MITGEKVDVLAPRAQIVLQIFLVFSAHDSAAEKIVSPFTRARHHSGLFFTLRSPSYNPGIVFFTLYLQSRAVFLKKRRKGDV